MNDDKYNSSKMFLGICNAYVIRIFKFLFLVTKRAREIAEERVMSHEPQNGCRLFLFLLQRLPPHSSTFSFLYSFSELKWNSHCVLLSQHCPNELLEQREYAVERKWFFKGVNNTLLRLKIFNRVQHFNYCPLENFPFNFIPLQYFNWNIPRRVKKKEKN